MPKSQPPRKPPNGRKVVDLANARAARQGPPDDTMQRMSIAHTLVQDLWNKLEADGYLRTPEEKSSILVNNLAQWTEEAETDPQRRARYDNVTHQYQTMCRVLASRRRATTGPALILPGDARFNDLGEPKE